MGTRQPQEASSTHDPTVVAADVPLGSAPPQTLTWSWTLPFAIGLGAAWGAGVAALRGELPLASWVIGGALGYATVDTLGRWLRSCDVRLARVAVFVALLGGLANAALLLLAKLYTHHRPLGAVSVALATALGLPVLGVLALRMPLGWLPQGAISWLPALLGAVVLIALVPAVPAFAGIGLGALQLGLAPRLERRALGAGVAYGLWALLLLCGVAIGWR